MAIDSDVILREDSIDRVPYSLRRLMEVLGDKARLSAVDECFAESFRCHMGIFSTRATAADWKRWVLFIRKTGRIDGLSLAQVELVSEGERWAAAAHWVGAARGSQSREISYSDRLGVHYRLRDGKIVELWTVPRNYVFVLGPLMNSSLGFLLVLVRFRLWCARQGESLHRDIESA